MHDTKRNILISSLPRGSGIGVACLLGMPNIPVGLTFAMRLRHELVSWAFSEIKSPQEAYVAFNSGWVNECSTHLQSGFLTQLWTKQLCLKSAAHCQTIEEWAQKEPAAARVA